MKKSQIQILINFWPFSILAVIIMMSTTSRLWVIDKTKSTNRQQPVFSLLKGGIEKQYLVKSEKEWIPIHKYRLAVDTIFFQRAAMNRGNINEEYIIKNPNNNDIIIKRVTHYLGTDILGRDILSRLMRGISISLFIGFMSITVSLCVGVSMGVLSGYFGGWVDRTLLLLINSIWSIPTILLVFALVLVLGRGVENIILAIGLTMWVEIARLVRGLTMKLKENDFIRSTRALGYTNFRSIRKHILPNLVDPLIVLTTVNFATAILVEAGISYLGFGVQPPNPSLGQTLADHYSYILGGHWMKSVFPATAIFLLVLVLNLCGNALRDHFDIHTRKVLP